MRRFIEEFTEGNNSLKTNVMELYEKRLNEQTTLKAIGLHTWRLVSHKTKLIAKKNLSCEKENIGVALSRLHQQNFAKVADHLRENIEEKQLDFKIRIELKFIIFYSGESVEFQNLFSKQGFKWNSDAHLLN